MTARICITGMGVVSAAGAGLPATLDALGRTAVNAGPLTLFQSPIACPVFEVKDLPPGPGEPEMRTVRLARAALREALREAEFDPASVDVGRVGVCMGTTVACQLNDLDFYTTLRKTRTAPLDSVERYLKGNLAAAIARSLGLQGPCATVVNACSSSADAIGVARSWLRAGLCDAAIAGGADELNRVPFCGFHSLGIMSPEPCLPFDARRRGLNLGEGAGVLILETEEHARRRGLSPALALSGYGSACDAYHLTAPRPDGSGLEAAVRSALAEAGIAPAAIAFVNAHGTATPDNDKVEGATLARVFGPGVRFLSTKGLTGHTLGAAGAIEAVFSAAALREGWIPASAGFAIADDQIPIRPVAERTPIEGRFALSTSLAFGGNNAALVVERIA